MRGSTAYQVQQVYLLVNEIGTSKHKAKSVARGDGALTWHDVGKELGIYSYSTADAYRDVWRACLDFAKQFLGIKDIEKLSGEAVRAFLMSKIDQDISYATLTQYAAAMEKLEVGLNRYATQFETGREYCFSSDIRAARKEGSHLERFEGSRAYADPDRLVAEIRVDIYHLAASIQREGGARISEANHLTTDNLRGIRADRQTGQLKGWIHVEGKGGKEREVGVNPNTYVRIEEMVKNGRFEFDKNAYREELKAAAGRSGQNYEGSHGLRWSWAQERHRELQQNGLSYEQTLTQISQEMGHERGDITEHYLQ